MYRSLLISLFLFALSCNPSPAGDHTDSTALARYFDYGETGVKTGGVRMIPIETPVGNFHVWTKRFGNNPRIKVLLLHGGPAATHEYLESFESFFPKEGFEFYEYDQLGSYYSDQPTDSSLWTTERFVDEVEQVRKAIGADSTNFYVYGNSWGGILAMEYALKYQAHIKGLIIGNMMSDADDYQRYADEVLAKQMDPGVLAEVKGIEARSEYDNPRYMELLMPNFYKEHLCRLEEWPNGVNRAFAHINETIYVMMQGPSEFGISGRLATWSVKDRLKEIRVPTLTVGATHDTMDPEHMKWMSTQVQKGRFLLCPNGSHMCMWDDQEHFFPGVIQFIHDVDEGKF